MTLFIWVIAPILLFGIMGVYLFKKIKSGMLYFFPQLSTKKRNLFITFILLIILLPGLRIYSAWFIGLLHFNAILLIIDLCVFILHKLNKPINSKLAMKIYKSGSIALILTAMIIGYGYYNIYQIERTEYTITKKETVENDYKMVVLSDLHYGITLDKKQLSQVVQRINKEHADMIVLDGDLVDENTTYKQMKEAFNTLGKIKSTYGVYYVYGNHDQNDYASSPNYTKKQLASTIKKSNITILEDQTVTLNQEISLIGRKDKGDGTNKRKSIKNLTKDLNKNNEWIVLDHQPLEYQEVQQAKCDVILSGHTHGGQVWPAGVFSRIFHLDNLNYGQKKMNQLNAIVTSGIAGWGYPIRTEHHSEYVVINVE